MRSTELPNFRTMTSAGHTPAGDTWLAFVFLSTIDPLRLQAASGSERTCGHKKTRKA